MLSGGPGPSHPRSTLLVALLASTLFFAALLAYEAHDAARSERVTAERALRDHASVAAWELQSAAREQLEAALARHFGAVTSGAASSPYEGLPALAVLGASVPPVMACDDAHESEWRTDARIDLRSGDVIARPPLQSPGDAEALSVVARRFVRDGATPERPTGLLRTHWREGDVPVALAARHARLGGPVAVYALVLCRSALGMSFFRDLVARRPLAPAAAAGTPNDSLFAVSIVTASGDTVFSTARDDASPYRVSGRLGGWGWDGWRVEVAVRRGAAEALLAGGGRSRVPLLIALLATSAALAVVALLQLRREHELARLRADFIAGVSHELRTPLAQILLFGETLALGRARGEAERRLAMDTIIHEARRLMHMVDNVLLFGRGRRLGGVDMPAPLALEPVVHAVVAGFEPLARLSGVRVEIQVPADVEVVATAGGIRQILLNLLDNALKYGPPQQVIVVGAQRDEEQVLLSVDDEGPGIPPPDRERVWSPYVRLRHDRGGGRSGSGIGLSVVRELTRSFGGAAWVEGGARGGSRFVVRLAAAPRPPAGVAGGTAA
jgi:signal transduction histidine kinase